MSRAPHSPFQKGHKEQGEKSPAMIGIGFEGDTALRTRVAGSVCLFVAGMNKLMSAAACREWGVGQVSRDALSWLLCSPLSPALVE